MAKDIISISKQKAIISISVLALLLFGVFLANTFLTHYTTTQTAQVNTQLTKQLQAIYNKIPTQSGKANFMKQSNNLTKKVDPELVDLDSQIITCDTNVDAVMSANPSFGSSCVSGQGGTLSSTKGLYMGGQCCGALTDTSAYHDRLKKLQSYKSMPNIPLDPMHTPITMAKQWIDFDNSTTLTADQQKIYDQAYAMSSEKPCCCKCWHYFVDEGVAKKMIQDDAYNAKQIAAFWDDSEICGT